jgi:hypothetical protein
MIIGGIAYQFCRLIGRSFNIGAELANLNDDHIIEDVEDS